MPKMSIRKKTVFVTGSAGLVGSESVKFFSKKNFKVIGVDNDMRRYFFGKEASTAWNLKALKNEFPDYQHHSIDIRDEKRIGKIFKGNRFDLIIHAAAQPSHDWASCEPRTDFSINAHGTLTLLEHFRKYSPNGVFIFVSTNKVYGDLPNALPLIELKTRYEIKKDHPFYNGIDETMSIDQSQHSLFGASKLAADLLVQEYGRSFGLKTVSFRCGCLSGPAHSGAQLHGFLAYLAKCIATGRTYKIFGYKGKQVRDIIHAHDLASAMYYFYLNPKCGEVYNLGGSRFSNISMMEAIERLENLFGKKAKTKYIKKNRSGDHVWYISNISKFKKDYPAWNLTYTMDALLKEICRSKCFS